MLNGRGGVLALHPSRPETSAGRGIQALARNARSSPPCCSVSPIRSGAASTKAVLTPPVARDAARALLGPAEFEPNYQHGYDLARDDALALVASAVANPAQAG